MAFDRGTGIAGVAVESDISKVAAVDTEIAALGPVADDIVALANALPFPPVPGDVNGPALADNNAIAVFDGTTGKLIKNGQATIDPISGNFNTDGEVQAYAYGINNSNSSSLSHPFGQYNTITNDYVYALGRDNNISGSNSCAFGSNNTVSGNNSIGIGDIVDVSGNSSYAFGESAFVSGVGSYALGYATTVYGNYSYGFGDSNVLDGISVFSVGYNNINNSNSDYCYLFGNSNSIGAITAATYSLACGHDNTIDNGTYLYAVGEDNTVSGNNGIALGSFNTVSGDYGVALGTGAVTRGLTGAFAYANGAAFAGFGSAQTVMYLAKAETSNNTPVVMTFDGQAATTTNQVILPNDSTYFFSIHLVARRSDGDNESAAYKFEGCIDRNANAASTALVGTPVKTVLAEDTAAWDVSVSADTTNGGLAITVTGENTKTIYWLAKIETVEVVG